MGTARKVGKRQLKVLCDCKRQHLVTADDEGELTIETFGLGQKEEKSGNGENKEKKEFNIFDLMGD
jgi:hypothetical protein